MVADMEAVVEREVNGRSPAKIRNLSIDKCKSSEITGLSEEYVNLEVLSIANAGLKSLGGLPKLPKLRELDLSSNQLDGGDLSKVVENCPKLERLVLKGNPIKDLGQLKSLEKLGSLKQVDLDDTDVAKGEEYLTKLREILPQLSEKKLPKKSEEDSGDDEDDDEEGDDDDSEDDGPGLEDLMKEDVDDDDDDEFNAEDDDDDEEYEDEDDDDDDDDGGGEPEEKTSPIPAGKKRKIHDVEKE